MATVTNTGDASHAMREQLHTRQAVALRILRNEQPVFVAVTPADTQGDAQDDGND